MSKNQISNSKMMNIKFSKLTVLALSLFTLITISSCEEDENLPATTPTEVETVEEASITANSEAAADEVFEDIDALADDNVFQVISNGRTLEEIESCRSVERVTDETTGVTTVTIDFGESCKDLRGRVRSGKVIIAYSLKRFEIGATRSIMFENFYVDSIKVEGTRTHTNKTESENATVSVWEVALEGGKLTFPDESFITRDANKTRSFDREAKTITKTGNASGITREGLNYSMEITTPIVFSKDCRLNGRFVPTIGTKVNTQGEGEDQSIVTINYGDGSCDNLMTIDDNGVIEEIEIEPKKRITKPLANRK